MYHSKCKSYAQKIVATVNSNTSVQVRAAAVQALTRDYIADKRDNPGTLRYDPARADDATKRQRVLYKGNRLRRYVERTLHSSIANDWITDACAIFAGITGAGALLVPPLPPGGVQFAPAAPGSPTPPVARPAPATLVLVPAALAPVPAMPTPPQGTPPVAVTRTARQPPPLPVPAPEPTNELTGENLHTVGGTNHPSDFLEKNFPPIDDAKDGEGWFRGATRLGMWSYDEGTADDEAFFNEPI